MSLLYSAVARGSTILCEYAAVQGNFASIATSLLPKMEQSEGKSTVTVDKHTFNFLNTGGYLYLVVAEDSAGRSLPFAYLDKIKDEFSAKYSEKGRTAAANSLSGAFGRKLKEVQDYCMQHPEDFNKISSVQKKVDEVKNIMSENIEKVLARGERLELLVDKTDNLVHEADMFQRNGRKLRSSMWWQACKTKAIIILVVVMLAIVLFCVICFSGGNCLHRKSN